MNATASATLRAAKTLKDAGFEEAQAEAIVATVDEVVREHTAPLANDIATILDTMATRESVEELESRVATKESVEELKDRMATRESVEGLESRMATRESVEGLESRMATRESVEELKSRMATREYVDVAIAGLRAEMAAEFKALYRHLWIMGTSSVGVTVALIKLLP